MMKNKLIAAMVVAGLASPAAASTLLDFTSSDIDVATSSGTTGFGVGWNITAFGGDLNDSTHRNNVGCDVGYAFECDVAGQSSYDVGFGVTGLNDNEVDGIRGQEYVQVTFDSVVKILGFAGMLTYNDSVSDENTEQTVLYYSIDGIDFTEFVPGVTQNTDADIGGTDDTFGTVGLSYADGLVGIKALSVRFRPGGTGTYDDGNANITAAALEVSQVPLPAGALLMGTALAGFGVMRRRKNKAAA